jgi:hypothetical protein
MQGKRIFTPADRALWIATVNAQVADFEGAVLREIPEFATAHFEDSTDVGAISDEQRAALETAGGILKAQLRRYALTIIPSNMCGCAACKARANIVMREYNECAAGIRAIQFVLTSGLVGMAEDRDRHFAPESIPPMSLN